MTERDRGRVHLSERRGLRARDIGRPYPGLHDELDANGYDLPDAPENPDFVLLFTEEEQNAIDKSFQNGIELRVLYDNRARELARTASADCHARFNKPKRPTKRKELRAKLGDIAHGPGRR